jgi:hypothetical protein
MQLSKGVLESREDLMSVFQITARTFEEDSYLS